MPANTRTLARHAAALHRAEVERWNRAWRDFWQTVDDAEPEAADALERFFAGLSDDDLDDLARGIYPDSLATMQAEAEACFAGWIAENGGDACSDAWKSWWETTGETLPRPDAPCPGPPDLSRWPTTVPPPPGPPGAEGTAFVRARLAAALPGSVEEVTAATCLLQLATARTLLPRHDARP